MYIYIPQYRNHDDVITWKHFPRYWPFVWGIYRSPMNSAHKSQWRRALICSLMCVWINGWVNNREACDLRRHRAHYDVTLMGICNWVLYSGKQGTVWKHESTNYIHFEVWMKLCRENGVTRQPYAYWAGGLAKWRFQNIFYIRFLLYILTLKYPISNLDGKLSRQINIMKYVLISIDVNYRNAVQLKIFHPSFI